MLDYRMVVFFLSVVVDALLLLAANRLCGNTMRLRKILFAGLFGGIYSLWCMLPGFQFLGSFFWHLIFLFFTGAIAYGVSAYAIRRIAVYTFLSLALSGVMAGMEKDGIFHFISAAGMVLLLCFFGFRGKIAGSQYLPVELSFGDKKMQITALRDTGNTLRDPITGRQVLVVGADVAQQLIGLTPNQLRTPVESIGALPGLRLVPYRTIDSRNFLLALHLPKVRIGTWQGGTLVAFAPNSLSPEGAYQALTGGAI